MGYEEFLRNAEKQIAKTLPRGIDVTKVDLEAANVVIYTKQIEEFRFSQAGEDLYAFTWNELADWYLEITKIQKQDDFFLRCGRFRARMLHRFQIQFAALFEKRKSFYGNRFKGWCKRRGDEKIQPRGNSCVIRYLRKRPAGWGD